MDVKKITLAAGFSIIAAMGLLAFLSMKQDALTYDELAHIGAGYSYLAKHDYRINPEHPPLIKDLAAVPLLFQELNFPDYNPSWTQNKQAPEWWVQFDLGRDFLFYSGNDPKDIIFWSRVPMIGVLILLALFFFMWAIKLGGNFAGTVALVLLAFSPSFLAHGRLVTTDVGASLGALVALYFWIKFLNNPSMLGIFAAGLTFGLAMLMKFNLMLLVPTFAVMTLAYVFTHFHEKRLQALFAYIAKAAFAGIIGLVLVVGPFYQFHIANYPKERQIRDTAADLSPGGITMQERITLQMAEYEPLRPLAQFFRGILMALQRGTFGNTVYFLGEISASGWWYYFPVIFFAKEPLALYFILLLGVIGGILTLKKTRNWMQHNFAIFSFLVFIAIYWGLAMTGKLNIGVRHLLPTLPLFYLIAAWGISHGMKYLHNKKKIFAYGLLCLLTGWFAFSSLSSFPHFISYFNELGGGLKQGYKTAVDSNYDWGQDFYRLLELVKRYDIQKLSLDYFGGENPRYWLKEKYVQLDPKNLAEPPKGWVAVSVNQLQGGIAKPVPGFDQQTGYYDWLKDKTPVDKAGNSIFLYYLE